MKPILFSARSRAGQRSRWLVTLLWGTALWPAQAQASIFHGETLDKVSNALAWVVLVIAPLIGIAVFWIVHVMPEKIAYKRQHPQASAIHTLCLLSLFFGGVLWPLAWLWAYSKPVMYKMAYGVDKVPQGKDATATTLTTPEAEELARLRQRVVELESKQPIKPAVQGGKA
jgi:CBS domain containing-hemolysin-like protein